MAEALLYEIRCIFCKNIHRSQYFDDIEEGILACRDQCSEWQKGRLDTWEDPHVRPSSCETEARAGMDSPVIYGV